MASWLPQTPAPQAIPAPSTSKPPSSILAVAWRRVKRRFSRSQKAGARGRGSGSEGGEPLGAAGMPPPAVTGAVNPALLHTTGSAPTGPGASGSGPFAGAGPSRIPKAPRSGGASTAAGSGTPSSRLLQLRSQAAPYALPGQPAAQQGMPDQSSGATPDPVRRLAFSPAGAAGWPGPPAASQPISIAAASQHRQQHSPGPRPGHQQEHGRQQWQHQQLVPQQNGQPAGGQGSGLRRAGSLPKPSTGNGGMPAPFAIAPLNLGASAGGSLGSSFQAQQLQLLGVPARSGLAGRWLREGSAEADGAADVDFILQMPPLQAAAREATRQLQVGHRTRAQQCSGPQVGKLGRHWCRAHEGCWSRRAGHAFAPACLPPLPQSPFCLHFQVTESDDALVLEWGTQLRNGTRILRPEVGRQHCHGAGPGKGWRGACQLMEGTEWPML